ncbi:hypothetical protein [Ktedonospora formicarum]|uniref:Uncharacterized protein n=1 Tax=Ktedonospora formicarum TaxID=2778364 RepID=A0A8J3I8U1_9CHLR|nr:hypothetical protein [Ktedonospora formicarum]GHO48142.1 hypothetical protein KSX_63050 [Ktedonospora formicarum]
MPRDKKQYLVGELFRDQRADGRGGFNHKDSAAAHNYQSEMANQDTRTTGSKQATVQSNAPVFQAYLSAGGDWQGRGVKAVDAALAAAYKEVQLRKKPADDACRLVEEQEAVVITSYTKLVEQYVGDLERSPKLESNVRSIIGTLERSATTSFGELIKLDRIRLEARSDHDANEVFYNWLQTQKNGIDPADWTKKRTAYIKEQKKLGGAATKERKAAEVVLHNAERDLKSSMRNRVRAETEIFKKEQEIGRLEKQIDDKRTNESLKASLTQKVATLRKAIEDLVTKIAGLLATLKNLVQKAIEAKRHQVHGIVREVHVRNAQRAGSEDFDLTA